MSVCAYYCSRVCVGLPCWDVTLERSPCWCTSVRAAHAEPFGDEMGLRVLTGCMSAELLRGVFRPCRLLAWTPVFGGHPSFPGRHAFVNGCTGSTA